jgi:hypothetical protein
MKRRILLKLVLLALLAGLFPGQAADLRWQHLSSATGDLPSPGPSTQQTGAVVADLGGDGVNGFVLSFRQTAPAVVWYRRAAHDWDRYVIESSHPDIIFGGDWQSDEVWWWENPFPNFDPKVSWKRHLIKKGGATQHHDQAVGDSRQSSWPRFRPIRATPARGRWSKSSPAKLAKGATSPSATPKAWPPAI